MTAPAVSRENSPRKDSPEASGTPPYRQVGSYALARGLPGIINFFSLILYTHLLGPESFGEYALAISTVSLISTVGFYWLDLGLVRFYTAETTRHSILPTVLRAFFSASVVSTGLSISAALYFGIAPPLLSAGIALLLAQSWHNLQLQLSRIQLRPGSFAKLSIARAIIAPCAASILISLGLGAKGLLLGLAIGALLPTISAIKSTWLPASKGRASRELTKSLLKYGSPLTLIFALRFIITSSDRFMLAHYLGASATGTYSAATELAGNTLGFITNIIQLAAFPLIIKAFEQGGPEHAGGVYKWNMSLLLTVTLPAAAGLALLGPQIATVFFPSDFASEAAILLPWIAAGALVAMIKTVGFDAAFHLTKRTDHQLVVVLLAALLNVLLNWFFIPRNGALGAAQATLITHLLALVTSLLVGRRLIRLPFPFRDSLRAAAATAAMVIALLPTLAWQGAALLGIQVAIGLAVYFAAGAALGLPLFRTLLSRKPILLSN